MNIEELINTIKLRPGMYVGCLELEPVYHFIRGFLFCIAVSNNKSKIDIDFRNYFHDWVRMQLEKRYNTKLEENSNYLCYISEVCPDPEEGLALFFELSSEFFDEMHKRD